ncbi:MAG TPA: coat protein, partial [Actinobacteria bacterium]|nr:coat protein [Actinomycetota bacterium]
DTVLSGATKYGYAGSPIATSYAEQINKVVAYTPEKRFADALKGLHLYGAKVTRGTALVVAGIKTA